MAGGWQTHALPRHARVHANPGFATSFVAVHSATLISLSCRRDAGYARPASITEENLINNRRRGNPGTGKSARCWRCFLIALGLIGYGIGRSHNPDRHVLVGRAYVGIEQASLRVDEWGYGFAFGDGGVTWYDARGVQHHGGIAPCLRHVGTHAWLRFGYSTAYGPDGATWREVTWVRCIAHP